MKKLFEILVPTQYGDTCKPIKTKHHKEWDKRVLAISGGLTILYPSKGKWIYEGELYPEKMIPVRVMCSDEQMKQIVELTLQHYRQRAGMFYRLSDQVEIVY